MGNPIYVDWNEFGFFNNMKYMKTEMVRWWHFCLNRVIQIKLTIGIPSWELQTLWFVHRGVWIGWQYWTFSRRQARRCFCPPLGKPPRLRPCPKHLSCTIHNWESHEGKHSRSFLISFCFIFYFISDVIIVDTNYSSWISIKKVYSSVTVCCVKKKKKKKVTSCLF